jgi:hypothetical protein
VAGRPDVPPSDPLPRLPTPSAAAELDAVFGPPAATKSRSPAARIAAAPARLSRRAATRHSPRPEAEHWAIGQGKAAHGAPAGRAHAPSTASPLFVRTRLKTKEGVPLSRRRRARHLRPSRVPTRVAR